MRSLLAAVAVVCFAQSAAATSLEVLSEFTGANGANPRTGLVAGATGRLFGTTAAGGTNGAGTVFALTPPATAAAKWSAATLHAFADFGSTGYLGPQGGRLLVDGSDRLYGVTYGPDCVDGPNRGVAFRLAPSSSNPAVWTRQNLAAFVGSDGSTPSGGLVALNGRYYGTTVCGGATGNGTVYELAPAPPGTLGWTKTRLVSFAGTDGSQPRGAGLITDPAGNLYGTTAYGGAYGKGTIFRLTPPVTATAKWTKTTLVNFTGTNGAAPAGALVRSAAGKFYGVTWSGGASGWGTVYELTPPATGATAWKLKTLVAFDKTTGANPLGSLVFDKSGNLYGATWFGGTQCAVAGTSGCGLIFRLSPTTATSSGWARRIVYAFDGRTGARPNGDLMVDAAGNVYGTAWGGGSQNKGTVFKLVP